jgi:hypothetical protein
MATYSVGYATVAAAAGAPYTEIIAGAGRPIFICEMGIFLNAATASSVGLIRSLAIGVTPAGAFVAKPEDPLNTATALGVNATTWGTAPTITANTYMRQIIFPAQIGAGVVWTWPVGKELRVSPALSILLWNFGGGAGSILNIYYKFEE